MRLIQLLILALCAFACSGAGDDISIDENSGKSEQAASTPCYIETRTAYACQPQYGRPATAFKVRAHNLGTVNCSYAMNVKVYSKPLTSPPTVIYETAQSSSYVLAPGESRAIVQTVQDLTGPMYWDAFYRYRNNGTTDPYSWHKGTGGPLTGPPAPPITCSDFPPI
jgi:hypothetical protein